MNDLLELADAARHELASRSGPLGLDLEDAELTPVLNWGGFVNRSFQVTAGEKRYQLKLTSDPEQKRGLEQWRALGSILERRYHAPRMITWLDVPGTAFSGPLFEWVAGTVPESLNGTVAEEVRALVGSLHADRDLKQRLLGRRQAIGTCADEYLHGHHERFTEDLAYVASAPPPFVAPSRIHWMWEQVRSLEAEVRASAPFVEPAASPTHRDLWLDNLIVGERGSVTVLDWDGLGLGDPVMDWAMLFGPSRRDPRPATERDVEFPGLTDGERDRLSLWARATLLDWIIDPLSDWVGAAAEPEYGAAIRIANEGVHGRALALYLELYG